MRGGLTQSHHRATVTALMGQPMLSQLRSIFDLVVRFQHAQETLFARGTEELDRRRRDLRHAYKQSLAVRACLHPCPLHVLQQHPCGWRWMLVCTDAPLMLPASRAR